jgi:hypothetical protein
MLLSRMNIAFLVASVVASAATVTSAEHLRDGMAIMHKDEKAVFSKEKGFEATKDKKKAVISKEKNSEATKDKKKAVLSKEKDSEDSKDKKKAVFSKEKAFDVTMHEKKGVSSKEKDFDAKVKAFDAKVKAFDAKVKAFEAEVEEAKAFEAAKEKAVKAVLSKEKGVDATMSEKKAVFSKDKAFDAKDNKAFDDDATMHEKKAVFSKEKGFKCKGSGTKSEYGKECEGGMKMEFEISAKSMDVVWNVAEEVHSQLNENFIPDVEYLMPADDVLDDWMAASSLSEADMIKELEESSGDEGKSMTMEFGGAAKVEWGCKITYSYDKGKLSKAAECGFKGGSKSGKKDLEPEDLGPEDESTSMVM